MQSGHTDQLLRKRSSSEITLIFFSHGRAFAKRTQSEQVWESLQSMLSEVMVADGCGIAETNNGNDNDIAETNNDIEAIFDRIHDVV